MKQLSRRFIGLAAIITLLAATATAQSLEGRWDANVTIKNVVIPFRLDIAGKGEKLTGTLFNGEQTQTTTSAKLENGSVTLNFEHYLTKIVATVKDGKLEGKVVGRFDRERYISDFPFQATRYIASTASAAKAPSINGLWEIPYESPKGEKAWRFIVKQNGAEVSASILRVDGDTGALTGTYRDGKFVVSHFDASRPLVLEITPNPDGTLTLRQEGAYAARANLTAYRPEVARAKGLPEPANFATHTTVRDPNEKFTFAFNDLDGKPVSSEDPRFKGKVIVAIVTGTWCPNCHDEAQYLVKLDRKYRDKGLAIVALTFEEPEQHGGLERAKAFVKQYGVKYTYLLAGAPAEMWEKVPQLNHLDTWPATLFVGRDGRIKAVHSGFASPASAEFHTQLDKDFTTRIEQLLAEKAPTQEATAGPVASSAAKLK